MSSIDLLLTDLPSGLLSLPKEVICYIVSMLEWKDYFQLRQTCTKIERALKTEIFFPEEVLSLSEIRDIKKLAIKNYARIEVRVHSLRGISRLHNYDLQSIDLTGLEFSRNLLRYLCRNNPDLHELYLDSTKFFNARNGLGLPQPLQDHDLGIILHYCKDIHRLDLSGSEIMDETVKSLSEKYKNLLEINLRSCVNITDLSLKYLSKNCKYLSSITLDGGGDLTEAGIQYLAENCRNLTHVNLDYMQMSEGSLHFLTKNNKNIQHLCLESMSVSSIDIFYININCHNLLSLDLRDNNITDDNLKSITEAHKKLIHLCIPWNSVTEEGLKHIGNNCKYLESLFIDTLDIKRETIDVILDGCKRLRELHACSCDIMMYHYIACKYPHIELFPDEE